jgi:hypothetical protein
MYLPIFIALLLGLISPAQQNCGNGNTTVQVNSTDPDGDPNDPSDPGDTGEDGDGGGHNGDNGTIRPTKP